IAQEPPRLSVLVPILNRRLGLRPLRLASRSAACCTLKDTRSAFRGSIVTVRLTTPSLRVLRVNSDWADYDNPRTANQKKPARPWLPNADPRKAHHVFRCRTD